LLPCLQGKQGPSELPVRLLDPVNLTWRLLPTYGKAPTNRGGHTVSAVLATTAAMLCCVVCAHVGLHLSQPLESQFNGFLYMHVWVRQLGVELPGCPLLLLLLQACLVGRLLYVFGGEDVQRRPLADVSVLDLDTLTWQVRWRARRGAGWLLW
jgi:hypothetical protein